MVFSNHPSREDRVILGPPNSPRNKNPPSIVFLPLPRPRQNSEHYLASKEAKTPTLTT